MWPQKKIYGYQNICLVRLGSSAESLKEITQSHFAYRKIDVNFILQPRSFCFFFHRWEKEYKLNVVMDTIGGISEN